MVASALGGPLAHADAESDAKDLFERGRKLRAAGDCASATPLFHKAYEIYPSGLGTLRNAAECEESLGRWASSRRSWLDVKRALMFVHDARYQGWDGDADAAAARLAPRVAHLRVDVDTGGRRDAAVEVTVNGERLARTLLGTMLDRDPGRYVVRARLHGREAHADADLGTGESRVLHLDVAPHGPLPTVGVVAPARSGSASTPASWVTLSVGVAALVGMGVAIGVRQDALATLEKQCPDYAHSACSPSLQPVVSRGSAASTATTALAIGGGVATGIGALLVVVGATAHHEGIAVSMSPWGLAVAGRF